MSPSTPGTVSVASGINESGRIVGASLGADFNWSAVRWHNGKIVDLNGEIGAFSSVATAINTKGQIVGWAIMDIAVDYYTAFLYEAGVIQFLPDLGGNWGMFPSAINDSGQIVGMGGAAKHGRRAFLWSEGVMKDLGSFDGTISRATGINNAGQIVGFSSTARGTRAFIWQNGVKTNLGVLSGDVDSEAYAINNKGQVVGISASYNSSRPWRWKRKC